MLVTSANELVFLFVGLELVSIPTYLLLYLARRNTSTQEAATKYFFLSIFSSGLLLFGLAYLYGMAGVSNLKALAYLAQESMSDDAERAAPDPGADRAGVRHGRPGVPGRGGPVPLLRPDVYQGSPTILAALLAWVPKGIGFIAILRTLTAVIPTDVAPPDNNLTSRRPSWPGSSRR